MFHVKQWLLGLVLLSSCEVKEYAEDLVDQSKQQKYLRAHNSIRKDKGLGPLVWNPRLEFHAKSWANHLATHCSVSYSLGSGFAELVSQHWGSRILNPERMVYVWSEGPEAKQILSPFAKLIGCGSSHCEDLTTRSFSTIYVCNYFPAESY